MLCEEHSSFTNHCTQANSTQHTGCLLVGTKTRGRLRTKNRHLSWTKKKRLTPHIHPWQMERKRPRHACLPTSPSPPSRAACHHSPLCCLKVRRDKEHTFETRSLYSSTAGECNRVSAVTPWPYTLSVKYQTCHINNSLFITPGKITLVLYRAGQTSHR